MLQAARRGEIKMQQFDGLVWKLYHIAEKITHILYVNLLWVFFTVLGLGVFGLFPATAAMFSVNRKLILEKGNISVSKTFWNAYKSDFFQINILGYSLVAIGAILYIDLRFFQTSNQVIQQGLSFIFFILIFLYFIVLLYIFPVFAHYRLKTFEYIKYSLILAIGRPLLTLAMIFGLLVTLFILKSVPILILYFGANLISVVLMKLSMRAFSKVEIAEEGETP